MRQHWLLRLNLRWSISSDLVPFPESRGENLSYLESSGSVLITFFSKVNAE